MYVNVYDMFLQQVFKRLSRRKSVACVISALYNIGYSYVFTVIYFHYLNYSRIHQTLPFTAYIYFHLTVA